MPCNHIIENGKVVGFCCSRGRRKGCVVPGCKRPATLLCDFPKGNGKTCDAPICEHHALHVGDNLDYCPNHENSKEAA